MGAPLTALDRDGLRITKRIEKLAGERCPCAHCRESVPAFPVSDWPTGMTGPLSPATGMQ